MDPPSPPGPALPLHPPPSSGPPPPPPLKQILTPTPTLAPTRPSHLSLPPPLPLPLPPLHHLKEKVHWQYVDSVSIFSLDPQCAGQALLNIDGQLLPFYFILHMRDFFLYGQEKKGENIGTTRSFERGCIATHFPKFSRGVGASGKCMPPPYSPGDTFKAAAPLRNVPHTHLHWIIRYSWHPLIYLTRRPLLAKPREPPLWHRPR